MKVPTFKFHGSKCRIAKWIFSYVNFPVENYYEPFAGRGNSFFYFAANFKYNKAFLNDKYIYYFLSALKNYQGDYQFVPDWIDRETFERFRDMPNCLERDLAESFCAYNGTFYEEKEKMCDFRGPPDHVINPYTNEPSGYNFYLDGK